MKQIVILAAGQSKRMKSKTSKVMHPLGGRPVVEYVLDVSASVGAATTVVVTSPELKDVDFKGAHKVIQNPARGTGDALKYALPHLAPRGDVVVLFGDTPLITQETLERVFEARFENPQPAVVVLGMRPDNPQGYGRLVLDGKGFLERIVEEKDATADEKKITLCNSGVMLIDGALLPEFLASLKANNQAGEYYLTDCVRLAKEGGHTCTVVEGEVSEFLGINTREDLARAEALVQERFRRQALEAGVTLMDPASTYLSYDTKIAGDVTLHPQVVLGVGVEIASDAVIYPFSVLEDTKVGPGAKVGPFARLRGHVVLGEKAEVGNFVEAKNTTFGTRAKAKHLSYVGDTAVGDRSNIGAGTITCNYDGFIKSKTVIGEDVLIGSNTSLVAPLIIGDGVIVGAGSVITKDTPAQALTVERAEQRILEGAAQTYRQKKMKLKQAS